MTPADLLPRCTFPPPGTEVTCAVSGGADSCALLVLAVHAGCAVTALHVDHGLRPGSGSEADLVGSLAERFGTAFESVRVSVAQGPNLEERARIARYRVLPEGVLTGHTADDQAETMILNLLRGAGLHGLAAMRRGEARPLLGLRRRETRELCEALRIDVVDDPSNADPRFRRNRVRSELVPLLDSIADRDVVPLLVRTADTARSAADHLDAEAARLDPTDASALRRAPDVLARLAVRAWLRNVDPQAHPPDAATIERVMQVARNVATATDVGGGWRVARTAGTLRLERASSLADEGSG